MECTTKNLSREGEIWFRIDTLNSQFFARFGTIIIISMGTGLDRPIMLRLIQRTFSTVYQNCRIWWWVEANARCWKMFFTSCLLMKSPFLSKVLRFIMPKWLEWNFKLTDLKKPKNSKLFISSMLLAKAWNQKTFCIRLFI